MGIPEASADDAVQDVFMVVHRRLAEFEGRSSIRTWLFGILARVVRDHRRARARHEARAAVGGVAADVAEQSAPTPADIVDVAAALGLNVNTTHARLRAARQQFDAAVARFRAQENK
jgi:RNA polymerase sigma-70 factor (ECF subfamily)